MTGPIRILVTGGGTGGHVSPALAVIEGVQRRAEMPGATFVPTFCYVGSASGIEAKMAREAGIAFRGVQSGKLRRSSRGLLGLLTAANGRDLLRIPVGVMEAMREVRAFRPDVVLATGGYVSVPPVLAAALQHIPILTHEQTVTVGLANQIAGRFATRIALTFEGAINDLAPGLRKKAFVTGNPVRAVIFDGERGRAVSRFGFAECDSGLPSLYITGGAQGSRILNQAVESTLFDLLKICRVVHQCGRQPDGTTQDFDTLTQASEMLSPALRRRYYVTRFVESDAIGDAYALADIVVARSGAGTVTEACALGKPALFVPLVPTGGDEQTRNAQRSVDAGAALILPQSECDGPRLLALLAPLLASPDRRAAMGTAALTLARPHAARDLADALLNLHR